MGDLCLSASLPPAGGLIITLDMVEVSERITKEVLLVFAGWAGAKGIKLGSLLGKTFGKAIKLCLLFPRYGRTSSPLGCLSIATNCYRYPTTPVDCGGKHQTADEDRQGDVKRLVFLEVKLKSHRGQSKW